MPHINKTYCGCGLHEILYPNYSPGDNYEAIRLLSFPTYLPNIINLFHYLFYLLNPYVYKKGDQQENMRITVILLASHMHTLPVLSDLFNVFSKGIGIIKHTLFYNLKLPMEIITKLKALEFPILVLHMLSEPVQFSHEIPSNCFSRNWSCIEYKSLFLNVNQEK